MKKLLCHKNILVRFISLYILGVVLFIIIWYLSYLFLPDGILRGKNIAAQLAGNDVANSFIREFLKIIIINLVASSLIVYANFEAKINGYPLGYLIPILWLVYYGLLLGTNSFGVPMPYRAAPSLEVLNRSGVYEIASYTLVAVSTYSLPRYEQKRFFSLKRKAINPADRHPMTRKEWIGIIVAVVLLVLSNLREVYMLMTK